MPTLYSDTSLRPSYVVANHMSQAKEEDSFQVQRQYIKGDKAADGGDLPGGLADRMGATTQSFRLTNVDGALVYSRGNNTPKDSKLETLNFHVVASGPAGAPRPAWTDGYPDLHIRGAAKPLGDALHFAADGDEAQVITRVTTAALGLVMADSGRTVAALPPPPTTVAGALDLLRAAMTNLAQRAVVGGGGGAGGAGGDGGVVAGAFDKFAAAVGLGAGASPDDTLEAFEAMEGALVALLPRLRGLPGAVEPVAERAAKKPRTG
jgi:hypothetical protein